MTTTQKIVVGNNRKGVFNRLIDPSVKRGVFKNADWPVLVVL